MKYSQVIIYYFTGTGNSQNVARWFKETAEKHNINCTLYNIADIDRLSIPTAPVDALIVFVSPIHGFNYPPVMINFIARFPKGNNKIVLMNTRAGMKIGKFVTPGLTGIAFYFSALILKLKGYSLVGMKPLDLPSNWISVHPGLNEGTVKYLHEVCKKRVNDFAERILTGKKDFRCLKEIIQDLLITPISLGYYFVGRFFLAKTYYASGDCNDCNVCVDKCPVKAIVKVDNRPFWTLKCESCMRCMSNCPKKAIETAHSFAALVLFLFYGFLFPQFNYFVNTYLFQPVNAVISFLIEWGMIIAVTLLSYRIYHYLLKFRLLERFFVFTSLTKYKFWGRRYKALKNF